ncbi:ABC transporter ATP-binding protein [Bradyrhizobium sp. U87765 SZCCT0131]|uniref:ABC transporter ATP-binding protein n=1 Tax=unclassified Bradyrhizobium TaxID=2631580 RepID=UPI001BAD9A3D|nr:MULTISPECIES: ABC transporter ATP-binding protein [unclassified Bradyrhizobium]MBR1220411.1 ABC transporter ATP-binding protein [Bradyrhizobium sp. U87765 SZCCT0131]MBR1263134.1 ABC transporter ATP-binding protein [Bradyrhizobium sp. U87765 SZCCT0134]MBR1306983.1 ABC transporter ATP-binding protein [Bradyrhizobium sp. U87765 SZCCT0110]MBR1323129.1 ABC transporter ATP-binding protein [Bradyrhizobium sp. U87765 SZCCT0109]MBR1345937.1 ABC transporter ATP-binding protein [Bradyrhizobium sp. U87
MLTLTNLQACYGASQVLFDVNLEVPDGRIVTLLGRNGMGKTTTVRAIMGLVPASSGLHFDGTPLGGATPEAIARRGIGLVPEGRMVFPTLTVRENLVATASNRAGRTEPWTEQRIYRLFPRLQERARQYAGTLSGGEQQMLAIGRALMTNPKLLILDEATEGLAPIVRGEIWRCIATLKEQGQSILLIDKNMAVLKRLADHHYILEKGRTVWSGDSAALDRDAAAIERYVGL